MRKIYQILLMAIAIFAVSFSAKAASITINVDAPERVSVSIAYEEKDIVAGDNVFEISDYTSISINAKDGNFITSVTRRGSYSESVYGMTSCNLYAYMASDYDGVIWDVVSCNADEARDAEVTIVVDEAANVGCLRSGSNTNVALKDGVENKVKFMSSAESCFTFSHSSYGKTLYQVTLNGSPVTARGSVYEVYPSNGDKIVVTSNYPDIKVPMNFSYAEGAEDFITGIAIDGTTVSDFNKESVEVQLGSKVTIYGDTQNFQFESMTINGEAVPYFYGSHEFIVNEADGYNIVVNARKYGTVTAYVTVDNPEYVTVAAGNYSNIISLESGVKTAVEVSENNSYIYWEAVAGCFIESVTIASANGTADYTEYSSISVTEGMEISITTGKINRDKTAIIWIDDISLADYSVSFYCYGDRYLYSSSSLSTGYTPIEFFEGDNPFYMAFYGSTITEPVVYQNGKTGTGRYGQYTFADQDVIKVFLTTAEPKTYDVTFAVADDVPEVTCVKDIITEVEAWKEGFSTLQGTQVDLTADVEMEVLVNGVAVELNEAGKYSFVVESDTEVSISADSSAIEGVEVDDVKDNNVYNLQGILVVKNATNEQINDLPTGLYIINGKKVAIK